MSDRYEDLYRHRELERSALAERSRRLSSSRGATFIAGVAALAAIDFLDGAAERLAWVGFVVLIGAFAIQVVIHRRVRRNERWVGALAGIAREGVLRAERKWVELEQALPPAERGFVDIDPDHAYAFDLDIAGRASIVRLAGPVTSRRGRAALAEWLLDPGTPPAARRRQRAVRELMPRRQLRDEFAAHGRLEAGEGTGSLEALLRWAESSPHPAGRAVLRWAGLCLPPLLAVGVWADLILDAGPWWLVPLIPQLWAARLAARRSGPTFAVAARAAGPARALVPQLRLLDGTEWESPMLADLRERIGHGRGAAYLRLEGLLRLLDWVESRRNIVYATLAPFLMLDVHLGSALDRWRSRHGSILRSWVDASASFEGLSAMATLADDHPVWTFPELSEDGSAVLSAVGLGHPLLPPERCVGNDVQVGPPGTFLLVTGSNMSGKSTLLRAVGLNAVLAGAGGPVAADRLSTPCVRVHTCMRIEDSLEEGVSLFMAELLRIRAIVDAARTPDPEGRPVLYLLDEMLHGTNTAERRVAARGVVQHLLETGAIGGVSTHDLLLAETPELADAARAVHFREEVEGRTEEGRPRILFDYVMRPGVATTRNALKLLEAVGLRVPHDVPGGHA